MHDILKEIDLEEFTPLHITIDAKDVYSFEDLKEGDPTEDEYGQSLDAVSEVRRAIKNSYPFEIKKKVTTIDIGEESEDENGYLHRDMNLEYYLLIPSEEFEEIDLDEIHDVLAEEWNGGSSNCQIEINKLSTNTNT
jgi:hypothetical protein